MYSRKIINCCILVVMFYSFQLLSAGASSQKFLVTDIPVQPLKSLKKIPVPGPADEILLQFVKDKKSAIQLGKALFWDTRLGSDNRTACASCHFHAGADNRVKNQINPGLIANDKVFNFGGVNYKLTKKDFPLPLSSNEIVTSQGVFNADFLPDENHHKKDECQDVADNVFHGYTFRERAVNSRKVENRHTPSVINAVFNFRQFWDGRANNTFNGIDPFGLRNETAYVWKIKNGKLEKIIIELPTSSMASQSSGPPLSAFEMSCANRHFFHIGKKLIGSAILANQLISIKDSVLGDLAYRKPLYGELIKKAFHADYWSSAEEVYGGSKAASMDLINIAQRKIFDVKSTQMESNFALFFGLSLQLYQSTLISDETPFDRFVEGDVTALSEQQQRGLQVFRGAGQCIRCHGGAEFTIASFSSVSRRRLFRIPVGPGITLDTGFFNIGVRPTTEDLGVGGEDPFGKPKSETRMVQTGYGYQLGNDFDPERNPKPDEIKVVAVDGAFKVPGLRNVELTGPYFHNGGMASLRQVVEFYDRGGDFRENSAIQPLGLTEIQKNDVIAFLLALTDERVRLKKAPFDHPSLCFPSGQMGNTSILISLRNSPKAMDTFECIPATGSLGVEEGKALRPFLNLDPFSL